MQTARQYLENLKINIEDTEYDSKYFGISDFDYVLTAGKNSITINGSELLKPNSQLKIEVIDSKSNAIYTEVARNYNEGVGVVVSIHVDGTIARGTGRIMIVGIDVSDKVIRWSQNIQINPSQKNKSQVRFYNEPKFKIKPYIQDTAEYTFTENVSTGNFFTLAKNPPEGTVWNNYDKFRNKIEYSIVADQGYFFNGNMVGSDIELSVGNSFKIESIQNKSTINLKEPITNNGKVINVVGSYTINYKNRNTAAGVRNSEKKIGTALVTFSNLETFTGNVTQYKIYRKSKNGPYESECVALGKIFDNEILTDNITPFGNWKNYGNFYCEEQLLNYWKPNGVNIEYSDETFVDSMLIEDGRENVNGEQYVILKLNSSNSEDDLNNYINYDVEQFENKSGSSYDSNSVELFSNTEYEISYDICLKNKLSNSKFDVYLKSSHQNAMKTKLFDGYGIKLNSISSTDTSSKEIRKITSKFKLDYDVVGTIVLVPRNCDVEIAKLSIKPNVEFSINPSVFSAKIPFDVRIKAESFEIKAELLDDFNNIVFTGLTTTDEFDVDGNTYPYNYLTSGYQQNSSSLYSIQNDLTDLMNWSSSLVIGTGGDCCSRFEIVSASYSILSQSYATKKKWSEL